jgi:cytochrome c biogenesis protein CcmG/thiol:disulfide interchange protein DsbE
VAAIATFSLVQLRAMIDGTGASPGASGAATEGALIERDRPAPGIVGTTLDGAAFDLASLRGTPVIVNFWGPSCIPCRSEFPLFLSKLQALGGDDLAVVGVLMDDAPAPARDFVAQFGATWVTVDDPSKAIRTTYRVAARPQSYFIDRDGILRSIQVGELTEDEFERQYALISGPATSRESLAPSAAPGSTSP